MDSALVQDVLNEVRRRLKADGASTSAPSSSPRPRVGEDAPANDGLRKDAEANPHKLNVPIGEFGVYGSVDQAVTAATASQKKLLDLSLDDRDAIVKLVKQMAKDNAESWGAIEFAETKVGRLDHKIEKLKILELVPGVEYLKTHADSGSNGVCLHEAGPFGVIGAVTPVTHSIPTLSANVINMVASGNAVVFNAHPSGASCAAMAVREYNRAIAAKFKIDSLINVVHPPTLQTAEDLFNARGIHLLVVTGGPAVARTAMKSSKRAIVAGPGNPPVVVDETADLKNAAESIIKGASYDNNLLCIGEKQVFVVESVFDKLMREFESAGAFRLNANQIAELTKKALPVDPKDGKPHVAKEFVGQNPQFLARAIGLTVPPHVQLLIGETNADHPFVQVEQMMTFVPIVKCRDVKQAMDLAIESEHGYRHTAICHSQNLNTITEFGRRAGTTLFVVNGPSPAGLGLGGQGFLSYSIATPTGEGITTPLTFTRYRRVMITGSLRMV